MYTLCVCLPPGQRALIGSTNRTLRSRLGCLKSVLGTFELRAVSRAGTYIYNRVQKIWEKLCKLRKSCNHKRNNNKIYNEKLHWNCLQ